MKIKSYSRIISTDYEEDQQPLVEKLGGQVNEGFDPLYTALSNRLTFEDNFLCTVREVEVTLAASGVPLQRTSFALTNTLPVKGLQVFSVINKTSASVFPTGAPFISYSQNGNLLYIDHITGLAPNNRYLIRILALN